MIFRTVFLFILLSARTICAQDTLEIPIFSEANINLDGKLTEPVYKEGCKISSFNQSLPVPDTTFPESTTVYIFQTQDGIYFGFHCNTEGRSPDKASFGDRISIYLDTYLDRKSAYLFELTANRTKMDARITDDGEKYDFDFETLWEGNAYCAENYFEAEIFIPWKGIMGKKGKWGLEIVRGLPNNTSGGLVAYNPYEERFRISRFKIMKEINFRGKEIVTEVQPMLVINHGEDFTDTESYALDFGGNIYLRMRENLKLGVTFNPDFAEIEADPFKLNFSKYALFYSETRPFFCEGTEFFSLSGTSPLKIFHSRQIGKTLPSGKIIPILTASKSFLKTDIVEVSALHARTKETQDIFEFESSTDFLINKLKILPVENFSISLLSAYRFPYKEKGKGLLGTQVFYQDPLTTLSIQQVFDNYTSKDYATKINFSKQIKEITISETITSIPENFSDQGVGYIPWEGWNSISTNISYGHLLNKRGIYSINSNTGFSYKREVGEPYVWDTNIGGWIYFQNRLSLNMNLSYGKDFELDTLFNAHSCGIGILTDRSRNVSIQLGSSGFKTYNYRQNYVGWIVINSFNPWIKFASLFSSINLTQWNEFNPKNNLNSTTYSLSTDIHFSLPKRCGLSIYMHLPFENESVLSERVGCYLSWNPSGKTHISAVYNDYRVHNDDWTPYIRKTTLKSRTSFYF